MIQHDLFSGRLHRIKPLQAPRDYQAEAMKWIENHKWAFSIMCVKAKLRARDGIRVSMKKIAEDVRDDAQVKKYPGDQWKIGNSLVSYLAREVVRLHPEVGKFIVLKKAKGDRDG